MRGPRIHPTSLGSYLNLCYDMLSDLSLAVSFSEVDVVAVGAVHVEVDLTDVGREPPRQAPHLLQELMHDDKA